VSLDQFELKSTIKGAARGVQRPARFMIQPDREWRSPGIGPSE
jgi:hypothetical protein